jgi:YbgC/YbaW family acyl-CoA thioester hydrolase
MIVATVQSPKPMQRQDFRFADRLRVRWAEIDAQKIVFNGHYLMYIDTAIAAYWRAMAMPYAETMESLQGDLYVKKATLEYHASARYDDRIEVGIRLQRIGTSSMVFSACTFRGDEPLVSGELVYVYADPATQTSRPVPERLRATLEAFEAGEPMVEVSVGRWSDFGAAARPIRHEVFVHEQRIPAHLEHDGADDDAMHALARNRFGRAVATGRLLQLGHGVAKIGRMAVLPLVRGSGVGRQVLDALMQAARERGDREVMLHAQMAAVPFYRRAGFQARGDVFQEAGVAHLEMRHPL